MWDVRHSPLLCLFILLYSTSPPPPVRRIYLSSLDIKVCISLSILLINKIQLSKCEDLIALIKRFMNQAASHLSNRDNSQMVVVFSNSVVSNSLRSHGLQHPRLPCPSPSPRVCSKSCPLSQWCHLTITSSVVPFSFCSQSFPAPGSFPTSQLFESGGQTTGVSASASVLPMNIQDWFPLRLTDLISVQSNGLSRVFSNTTVQKHQFFSAHLSSQSNSHIHTWPLEKPQP